MGLQHKTEGVVRYIQLVRKKTDHLLERLVVRLGAHALDRHLELAQVNVASARGPSGAREGRSGGQAQRTPARSERRVQQQLEGQAHRERGRRAESEVHEKSPR